MVRERDLLAGVVFRHVAADAAIDRRRGGDSADGLPWSWLSALVARQANLLIGVGVARDSGVRIVAARALQALTRFTEAARHGDADGLKANEREVRLHQFARAKLRRMTMALAARFELRGRSRSLMTERGKTKEFG